MEIIRFESLKPYIEEIIEKIIKNEEIDYKFSSEILNSVKERIEKKNEEKIWQYLIEGVALIQKINQEKKIFQESKDSALKSLKIGQEIQSDIKKEIGNLIMQGKKKMANEIQEFNYKLFETLGSLRVFEEKEKIEEVEVSFPKKEEIKSKPLKNKEEKSRHITIKRIEKKEKNIGRKIIYIAGIIALIAFVSFFLFIKKGKSVEYTFDISEFTELPDKSTVERGNYDLKITVPEEFWDSMNKKKKMEVINKVASKIDEKGYLMLEFYSNNGEKLGKWIKNEKTYIYK